MAGYWRQAAQKSSVMASCCTFANLSPDHAPTSSRNNTQDTRKGLEEVGMGRKSTFNDKDAAEIVARLSKGEPLAVICRDDWLPCDDTVRNWADANPAFARDIARAREAGFDALAAECLQIAEDGSHDYKHKKRANGEEYEEFDAEHVQRSKLRIETRLKLLAKWDPKRYGDKVTQEHTGAEGGPIMLVTGVPRAND